MSVWVLQKTQDEATSNQFQVPDGKGRAAHVTVLGLAGAESASLYKQDPDGSWPDDPIVTSTFSAFSSSDTSREITAAGVYRVKKAASAANVGVQLSYSQDP